MSNPFSMILYQVSFDIYEIGRNIVNFAQILAILVINRKARSFTVCGLRLSRQKISSHTVSRLDLPTLLNIQPYL